MEKLTQTEIEERIQELPDWSQTGDMLQQTFSFSDFAAAIGFVNRIAELAERRAHHPDIMIRYNKVTLSLSTHDAGGITQQDFDFAAAANDLAEPQPSRR